MSKRRKRVQVSAKNDEAKDNGMDRREFAKAAAANAIGTIVGGVILQTGTYLLQSPKIVPINIAVEDKMRMTHQVIGLAGIASGEAFGVGTLTVEGLKS